MIASLADNQDVFIIPFDIKTLKVAQKVSV